MSATTVPATLCSQGSPTTKITDDALRQFIYTALEHLGPRDDVLLLPPDFTRFHSQAGKITQMICQYYNFIPTTTTAQQVLPTGSDSSPHIQILPALGTHAPMTDKELRVMYGDALADKQPFVVHDWRKDVVTIGHVPADMVAQATYGQVTDKPWPAQVNKLVWEKRLALHKDDDDTATATAKPKPLVLSIGQVVPHEGKKFDTSTEGFLCEIRLLTFFLFVLYDFCLAFVRSFRQ